MMHRAWAFACAVLLIVTSCGRTKENSASANALQPPVHVSAENIVRVRGGELISGPLLSGEVRAAHSATVRAEVGGAVFNVRVEEGQRVRRGDLLGRIDSPALADAQNSARSAVRSAQAALELARVEVRRDEELVAAGAIAQRDLDQARAGLAAAEAQLANARASLATAEEHLGNTVLRAPLSGIVSVRMVDSGDVVTVGAELFTIIDPSSMRVEASVPSEQIAQLRIGKHVRFTISGYDEPLEGRIEKISPQADPVSRQISVYVTIPDLPQRLAIGQFVEGRVVAKSASGVVVPENAIADDQSGAWVLRVRDGKAERAPVTIVLRDPLTERVVVTSGLMEGDIVLRGTDQAITPGTAVDITR